MVFVFIIRPIKARNADFITHYFPSAVYAYFAKNHQKWPFLSVFGLFLTFFGHF